MVEETAKSMAHHSFIQKNIASEQLRILHTNLLIAVPANFICATVIFFSLHSLVNGSILNSWFIAVIFVSLFRLFALHFYHHHPRNNHLHLFIFIFGLSLSVGLWGFAIIFFMPKADLLHQMVIIVIIAGLTAGGIQTLNASLLASLVYISFTVVPLCVWSFLQSGNTYLAISVSMIAYLFFMVVASIRGYKLLEQSLTLRYKNLSLIDDLSISNEKLLQSYRRLEQQEHEILLINKMNDMLQTCRESNEAYPIIMDTAKAIFVGVSGGLAILNLETNALETVNQWGDHQILRPTFNLTDCWALRKGHSFFVKKIINSHVCRHFNSNPNTYLCLPLLVQNGVIGLLVLHTATDEQLTSYQQQLASSFSEVIQLSLTNIKLRETLYEQSIHDPLTGLFNRRYLDEKLGPELQRAIKEKTILCVAMLDLDYFKSFNDSYGHEAGDEALKCVGNILKKYLHTNEIACRYGGEEFLVILFNCDLAAAFKRLQFICDKIRTSKLYFHDKPLPSITVSIGLAEAPLHGTTVKEIIQSADETLYSAKKAGRNQVACAKQAVNTHSHTKEEKD